MNTLFSELIVGTTLTITGGLLRHYVLPLYHHLAYRGLSVAGKWTVMEENIMEDGKAFLGPRWTLNVTLRQRGDLLMGDAIATQVATEGKSCPRVMEYKVKGDIDRQSVTLKLRNRDSEKRSWSAFVLCIKGDGCIMVGQRNFFGLVEDRIRTVLCIWIQEGTSSEQLQNIVSNENMTIGNNAPFSKKVK
ncbi:MAG TPA: hypothetical protein VKV04_10895 [Verrucomicrobiae bacterium]|nr:hypothetical protein [Verrucomicrobiae bacterium]